MSRLSERCADIRALLPELALGIADGEARAEALEHLAGCPACRRELEELTATTDDLMALAPEREPPPGFEARVLERLGVREASARRPRRRFRFKRIGAAAALAATAAVTAAAMVLVYSDDHRLASQYRAALHGANGQYFQSARLRTADGRVGGTVFGYQGSPSWMFYVVDSRYAGGVWDEQIVTRSGRTVTLPAFRLVDASWGVTTPVPLRDIASVRLIRSRDGVVLSAPLPRVKFP